MKQFEYSCQYFDDERIAAVELHAKLAAFLKDKGEHGWELCSYAPPMALNVPPLVGIYIFKREIIDSQIFYLSKYALGHKPIFIDDIKNLIHHDFNGQYDDLEVVGFKEGEKYIEVTTKLKSC